MENQQLLDYIKKQKDQGMDDQQIKSSLLQAGWPEVAVNQSLGLQPVGNMPTPPLPPPVPNLQAQPENYQPQQQFENTGPMHLDPKAVWIFFIRSISAFLVLFFIISFTVLPIVVEMSDKISDGALGVTVLIVLPLLFILFMFFGYMWAKLTYKNYKYELTEFDFKKESGVILKKYVNIPYDQVQNVREVRGIMDRILGLADINIFTAGSASFSGGGRYGGTGEGYLPGLSRESADKLREEISTRSRIARNRR